jgi:hypothetical protein
MNRYCYPFVMGVLADTTSLVQKYPITFLAVSALAALCLPVLSVTTSSALRPFAKRILTNALAARREAERAIAESKEAYADLVAEATLEADYRADQRRREPAASPVERPYRVDAAAESAAMPVA